MKDSEKAKTERLKAKDSNPELKINVGQKIVTSNLSPKNTIIEESKSVNKKAQTEKTNSKRTKSEKITLLLSSLAFLISLISFYFQFFHINERVVVTNLDYQGSLLDSNKIIDIKLALVNTGDVETFILKSDLSIDRVNFDLDTTRFIPLAVESNDIKVLNFEKKISSINVSGNEDLDINLNYRFISGKGYDKSGKLNIGKLFIINGEINGMEILKSPQRID